MNVRFACGGRNLYCGHLGAHTASLYACVPIYESQVRVICVPSSILPEKKYLTVSYHLSF